MGDSSRRLPWNLLSVIGKKRKFLFSDSALADCVIPQVQRAQAYGKVIAVPSAVRRDVFRLIAAPKADSWIPSNLASCSEYSTPP